MATKTPHDNEKLSQGQQVITACAFIHRFFKNSQKVFVPKRAATKKFLPGVYELPGGHIDFGEDIVEGLKREVKEEFSLEVNVGDPFYVFTYDNQIKGSHSIEVVYFATFVDLNPTIKLNNEDHSEYKWISEHEIPSITTSQKGMEDPEIKAIKRGFELLKNGKLNFG